MVLLKEGHITKTPPRGMRGGVLFQSAAPVLSAAESQFRWPHRRLNAQARRTGGPPTAYLPLAVKRGKPRALTDGGWAPGPRPANSKPNIPLALRFADPRTNGRRQACGCSPGGQRCRAERGKASQAVTSMDAPVTSAPICFRSPMVPMDRLPSLPSTPSSSRSPTTWSVRPLRFR